MEKWGFIIVLDGSSYNEMYQMMFHDVEFMKNVTFVVDDNTTKCLKKILLKDFTQKFTKGYLDFLVCDKNKLYYAIEKMSKRYDNVSVIFLNAALYYNRYLAGTLIKYKRKWRNLSYVLLYLDIVNTGVCKNANYLRKASVFDLVYTIDPADAEEISANLIWTPYSRFDEYEQKKAEHDLYFCGASKNRENMLLEIVKKCRKSKVDVKMDIVFQKKSDIFNDMRECVNVRDRGEYLSYHETLNRVLEAKCILEIVQPGQNALTIRPFEAVCYGRKLLTNNKTIKKFPFYIPKYMQYFEKVEDIDWHWVMNEELVNYNYKGEFSPKNLLEDIFKRLNN